MDEKTRQLVLDALAKAHAAALASVQARLSRLATEDREAADRSIDEFRACLLDLFANSLSVEVAQERLTALIHGHPSPLVIQVLKDYAEAVNYLLLESRNGLLSQERPKGN